MITVPVKLLCGVTPVQALATNKLQGAFGSGIAAISYAMAGHPKPLGQWQMALIAGLSAGACSLLAHFRPPDLLRSIMPFFLIAVALYFWLKPGLSDEDRHRRLSPTIFGATAVPLLAFYDGFFGPGTGSFYKLAFVLLAGQGVLKATAHTKFLNFASNIGSLNVFAFEGHILWVLGLAMAAAQVAGAILGARAAIRVGAGLVPG